MLSRLFSKVSEMFDEILNRSLSRSRCQNGEGRKLLPKKILKFETMEDRRMLAVDSGIGAFAFDAVDEEQAAFHQDDFPVHTVARFEESEFYQQLHHEMALINSLWKAQDELIAPLMSSTSSSSCMFSITPVISEIAESEGYLEFSITCLGSLAPHGWKWMYITLESTNPTKSYSISQYQQKEKDGPFNFVYSCSLSSEMSIIMTYTAHIHMTPVFIPFDNDYQHVLRVYGGNDGIPEPDETITITVADEDGGSVSASGTIKDDDHWKVSVEISEEVDEETQEIVTLDTTIERLPDVDQQYGGYTIKRTHAIEDIAGDTRYAVSVAVDMIYDSADPHSADNKAARPGSDYMFQYQNASGQWITPSTPTPQVTGTVSKYRYNVSIPIGQTEVKVRLVPNFDWEDEGVLFDPTGSGTPKADIGENAWLEIVSATWTGMTPNTINWDPVDHTKQEAKVEIKDGAIVKIRTDSNNDGVINQDDDAAKKVPGNSGRLFMVNDDDDNDNDKPDNSVAERPIDFDIPKNRTGGGSKTVTGENDLAETRLYAWVDCLTPQAGKTAPEIDIYLAGPQEFVVWTQTTKGQRLHYGKDADNNGRMDYETTLTTLTASQLTFTQTIHVEANTMRPGVTQSGDILLKADVISSSLDGSDDVRFTPVKVECIDMAFNHEPGTNSDGAMNLREDGTANTEIIAPEWSRSADTTSGNDGSKNRLAVLYLPNRSVDVYARLKTTNIPAGTEVSVKANGKAVDAAGNETALSIGNLQEQIFVVQSDGSLLPKSGAATKTINGIAGFIKFTVSGTTKNAVYFENAKFEWEVTQIGGNTTGSNQATIAENIKIFTVLADPTGTTTTNSPWSVADTLSDDRTMPWVTALEFAIQTANTKDSATPEAALSQLTRFLHGQDNTSTTDVIEGHSVEYDTINGAARFNRFDTIYGLWRFELANYINRSVTTVNCYDQAAAVYTLGRLLGIETRYAYMEPFGYINTVNLVGVGNCNNPFYENGIAINSPVVGPDLLSPNRTYFGNHAFVMLGNDVYDACALTVNVSFSNYLTTAIDTSTAAERAVAGTSRDRVFHTVILELP